MKHSLIRQTHAPIDPLKVIQSLAKLTNPDQAFPEVLSLIVRWFRADSGQIVTRSPRSAPMVRASTPGITESDRSFSRTIFEDALEQSRVLVVPDAKSHPDYRSVESVFGVPGSVLSVVVVPLHDEHDRAMGAVYLQWRGSSEACFSKDSDLESLQQIVEAVGPALLAQEERAFLNGMSRNRAKTRLEEMGYMIGTSSEMDAHVFERLERYARSNLTVCTEGEAARR